MSDTLPPTHLPGNAQAAAPRTVKVLEGKIFRARLAMVAEAVWRRMWILFGLAGLFVLVSLAGLWPLLDPWTHRISLGLFGLGFLVWLVVTLRIPWPSREDAIRRIERVSGIPHRPASAYEDTLSSASGNAATEAIWQAHKRRMANLVKDLRPGAPAPRTHLIDPIALRAILPLALVVALGLAGSSGLSRLGEAFEFGTSAALTNARLDAWVTPPAYTGRTPIMLADGRNPATAQPAPNQFAPKSDGSPADAAAAKSLEVPEGSLVVARLAGAGTETLTLEVAGADDPKASSTRVEGQASAGAVQGLTEARVTLDKAGTLRVLAGGNVLREWPFTVIPDNAPGIALTKNPERTERGAMKLTYFVQDDYGVASAEVVFKPLEKVDDGDPKTAWARPPPPTGPRPPYSRPPQLALRLPAPNAKQGEAFTYHEMGSHPWAGRRVTMTLVAKDVGGKTGQTLPIEVMLPEREFKKPLARAVIEQRKLLLEDPRHRARVGVALAALTLEPQGFIDDARAYLALRSSLYRLERDTTRAATDSVIEQLWFAALRLEDGDLSEAERNLRDVQDRLAKALEEGASDEEIQRLMQELRDAFQDYAREMAEQAEQQAGDQQQQDNQSGEQMSAEDLDRMMKEMEEMAKSGLREQAKDMLAQMRDMMERMQAQKQQSQEDRQRNADAEKMMRRLGEATGEQQNLMDDTFDQRREQQQGQGQMKQQGQAGQRGQRGQGMQADRNGQMGQGNDQGEMQLGERGRDGKGPEGGKGQGGRQGLAERQRQLRERLDALRKDMQEKGLGDGERLGEATDAMEDAERALEQGDFDQANQDQGRALDAMRESAEEMASQMQQNNGGQQRFGQNGDSPRDPLGRPQRSRGPDQGRSVKVPDQIDMQRAREVLEELRRRLGEATRPEVELQYLERLLKWN
ncbi:MAG: TIGR02302 family protein [Hyphomicrobium sp.]|nr:TIGR02302 family protein [Hyphomicrobium sp.]